MQYVKPSLLASLLGQTGAMIAGAAAVPICLGLFWYSRKAPCGSDRFNFAVVAALALTMLLVPAAGGANYNQVLLIPGAIWLCIPARRFAQSSPIARATWLLAVCTLAGEWVLAVPVSFAGLVLRHRFQREATYFVAGPEFLLYVFPLMLALFALSVAPKCLRRPASPEL